MKILKFMIFLIFIGCDSITKTEEIHNAAADGDIKQIEKILALHPEIIDTQNALGWTPLYLASMEGKMEIVKFLITKGANVELGNKMGETPLAKACKFSHLDVVEILIEAGADVNCYDIWGITPLHEVARTGGNLEIAKLLISRGAKVLVKNYYKELPSDSARKSGHTTMADFLKKKESEAKENGIKEFMPVIEDPAKTRYFTK